jgi:hypothetical protein
MTSTPSLSLRAGVCHSNARNRVGLHGPCYKTGSLKAFRPHHVSPFLAEACAGEMHLDPEKGRKRRAITLASESPPRRPFAPPRIDLIKGTLGERQFCNAAFPKAPNTASKPFPLSNFRYFSLPLNRSQYGGCSTGLQHPDRYLGRLRTISRLHVYLVIDQKPAQLALSHR